MEDLKQWVCWKSITRNGRATKIPINAKTGTTASSTDCATWVSRVEAQQYWNTHPEIAGIGFVFTPDDGYCGIDIDGCITDGVMSDSARHLISRFNSYTEISPSGNGVKIFIRGKKPSTAGCRAPMDGMHHIEIYDKHRFFTVTGNRFGESPAAVNDAAEELEKLCLTLWPRLGAPAPRLPVASSNGHATPITRAAAYLRKLPPAIEGNGGDSRTFEAACHLARFGISETDAWPLMEEFNRRCVPPWDDARLRRKLREGYKRVSSDGQVGAKLDAVPSPVDTATSDEQTYNPRRTLPTAYAFLKQYYMKNDIRTLHTYAGSIWTWEQNHYRMTPDAEIAQVVHPWLHGKSTGPSPYPASPPTVTHIIETLRTITGLRNDITPPTWLSYWEGQPEIKNILVGRTTVTDLSDMTSLPPQPELFAVNSLGTDYDSGATTPGRWVSFLQTLWPTDQEAIDLLQDWFGYLLTPDTSQQKMLFVVGPRRSGKGTIARILQAIIGAGNCCGPNTSSLAGPFGMQALIGKTLAIVADARFTGHEMNTVVERLLCISGEDTVTVDRKFEGAVTVKLPVRFTFLSNELPRLSDASNALTGRMMVLRLKETFYGREDPALTEKLCTEVPGIMSWAVEGWKRLRARGYFVQPRSSQEAISEMEDLASPVGAFVREKCTVDPNVQTPADTLYDSWKSWCEDQGIDRALTRQVFGRNLRAVIPGIQLRQNSVGMRHYVGISV